MIKEQTQEVVRFKPTRDRWADKRKQELMLSGKLPPEEDSDYGKEYDDYGFEIKPDAPKERKILPDYKKKAPVIPSMNQLVKGSEEIQWWLNRAISYVKPFLGEVTRYV